MAYFPPIRSTAVRPSALQSTDDISTSQPPLVSSEQHGHAPNLSPIEHTQASLIPLPRPTPPLVVSSQRQVPFYHVNSSAFPGRRDYVYIPDNAAQISPDQNQRGLRSSRKSDFRPSARHVQHERLFSPLSRGREQPSPFQSSSSPALGLFVESPPTTMPTAQISLSPHQSRHHSAPLPDLHRPIPQYPNNHRPSPQRPKQGQCVEYLGTEIVRTIVPRTIDGYDPTDDVKFIDRECHSWRSSWRLLPKGPMGVIHLLICKSGKEVQVLSQAYHKQRRETLAQVLEEKFTGVIRDSLLLLIKGPLEGDFFLLNRIERKAVGHRLDILMEIIVRRNPVELTLLKEYTRTEGEDLDQMVNRILAKWPSVRPLFEMALQCPSIPPLTPEMFEEDYAALREGLENNETSSLFLRIILQRPHDYLNKLYQRYQSEHFGKSVAKKISDCFKDVHLRKTLLYAVEAVEADEGENDLENGIWRDVKAIEQDVKNSIDEQLNRRLIRAHWDQERFQRIVANVKLSSPRNKINPFARLLLLS